MTVTIGIAVPEGIIIAGDSRTTYVNARGWPKISSDYTQKVYQITSKVGAGTFGWAILNGNNINSLVEEFKDHQKNEANINEVLPAFIDYFEDQYNKHIAAGFDQPVSPNSSAFGFILAGYDDKKVGKVFVCHFPGKIMRELSSTSSPGATWQGQTDIISRIIKGFDPRLDLSLFPQELRDNLSKGEYVIYFNRMNLQDAVDFSVFLVRTTIDMQRFSDGIISVPGDIAGVGGFIDVLLITNKETKWIQKKELRGEVPSWISTIR
jgi:hypothetical protein